MGIIRVSKDKDNPYVVLNKTCLEDVKLSWQAKGLHSYLISKPDHWKIYVN
ncbi:replication protein, partial [Clostridioides difficile]|nr:replication protein [Clostridioides difficile]MCU5830261.1 replication protein [Clostridioides difficile]